MPLWGHVKTFVCDHCGWTARRWTLSHALLDGEEAPRCPQHRDSMRMLGARERAPRKKRKRKQKA